MATHKQRMAIEQTVENGGNTTQGMRDAGYSEATINNPSNLTQSKGYKQLLAEYGLTEGYIIKRLMADIESKPERRLGELTLASDLLGLRKKALIIEEETSDKPSQILVKFLT